MAVRDVQESLERIVEMTALWGNFDFPCALRISQPI